MFDLREKTKEFLNNIGKKGFIIDIDSDLAKLTKTGYIPPNTESMQNAIEKYCAQNKHELTYIRLSNPIIFMIDGNEVYEARPELMRRGIVPQYVVRCTEFK